MNRLFIPSLLLVAFVCWMFARMPAGELQITCLVNCNDSDVMVEVSPLAGEEALQVSIDLPKESELWLSLKSESGKILDRERFQNRHISHRLDLARYSDQIFQLNISYVFGGTLYSSRVEKYMPVAGK